MPELMAQIVVASRERCHDRALLAAHVPECTRHGTRRGRDGDTRDSGAVFKAIRTDQILDFGLVQNPLFCGHGRETHRIHLWGFEGHGLATGQQQQYENEASMPETAQSCLGTGGR